MKKKAKPVKGKKAALKAKKPLKKKKPAVKAKVSANKKVLPKTKVDVKKIEPDLSLHSAFIGKESEDKAHSPGHRKMNVKDNFTESSGVKTHQQASAVNNMSNANRMRRHTSAQRRVINGAAIGKTGRISPVK